MRRVLAVTLAAGLALAHVPQAAGADARAASGFPEVPLPSRPAASHRWAYATLAGGIALAGASFVIADRANARYDDYLRATDPGRIDALYRETTRLDRWSTASLLAGEALVVTGLYLRFLRRDGAAPVALAPRPGGCALSWRF